MSSAGKTDTAGNPGEEKGTFQPQTFQLHLHNDTFRGMKLLSPPACSYIAIIYYTIKLSHFNVSNATNKAMKYLCSNIRHISGHCVHSQELEE